MRRPPRESLSAAMVSDAQGDSLSVSNVVYAQQNPHDYVFGWCSDDTYAAVGNNLTICSKITVHDAVTGDQVPQNNYSDVWLYDACGAWVANWHLPYWHMEGQAYFSTGTIYTSPYIEVPSNFCSGTWHADVTFSETFTDGTTLTASDTGYFSVLGTQAAPTGGPVQPEEQFGGCGCGYVTHSQVAQPVDTATGNFWHSFTDLATSGRGPALDLSRTYNSMSADLAGRFGYGWTDSYAMSLASDNTVAVITQANGSRVTFTNSGSGWSAPPRVLATLSHNVDGTWTFTRRSREFFDFDSTGRLTAIRDLNGYETTLTYPSSSTQIVTDTAGRSLSFTITGGHVTMAADSATPARTVSYSYDANGDLTDVIDAGGGHWTFTYDSAHRMLTMRSPRFYGDTTTTPAPVTTNHYDSSGRVDWQSDPLGRVTSFDYSSIANSTKVTDPKGNVTVYEYQDGLLIAKTVGYGSFNDGTWRYRYDPDTLGPIAIVDPGGNETTASYDAEGNKLTASDGFGRTTSYTYNSLDEPTSITEPKTIGGTHVVTTVTYDTAGNLLSKSTPLLASDGSTIDIATTVYHHDDASHPGDTTSVTDPNGHTTTFAYDQYGDLVSKTSPPTADNSAGNTTSYTYDTGTGWLTSTTTPRGNLTGADAQAYTTTYDHDPYGHVTTTRSPLWTVANPTRHRTVVHYDADGNRDSVTDGMNHTTTYLYDAAGEPTEVQRPDGTRIKTEYWPDGTIHRQIDGLNHATVFDYDEQRRLTTTTDPLNRATTYTYDDSGNVRTKTDADSNVTTNTYDDTNRLVTVSYSDGVTPNVTGIGYDADGQRISMTDGTGTSTWSYDSLHRLTTSSNGAGKTVGYGYDLGGRLTSVQYPDAVGTVDRVYDDADRMVSITDWSGSKINFEYDADSNLVDRVYPNGTQEQVNVDADNEIASISDVTDADPQSPFLSFSYTRNGADQLTGVSTTGMSGDNHAWDYDTLNRLTTADAASYSYDAADNLTGRTDGIAQGYDAAHQLAATALPISLVGTNAAGDSTSSSLSLALPTGTTTGDQVLLGVVIPNNKNINVPTGFTSVGSFASGTGASAANLLVYRRTAAAGDPPISIGFGKAYSKTVVAAVYRNVDAANPVDVAPSSGSTSAGTSVTASGLTAVTPLDRLVLLTGANGTAGTWGAGSGMSVRTQQTGGTTDAAVIDELLNAAGDTGSRTATHTPSSGLAAAAIALKSLPSPFTYDDLGRRTASAAADGTSISYIYDQASRLTSYSGPDGSATYTYDGTGRRITKTVSGTTTAFTWDQASSVPALLAEGSTYYLYGPDGAVLAQRSGSDTLYYHHDQLGSIRALTASNGSVAATFVYDAYGRLLRESGSATTPFGYAGEYRDVESGLMYLRARYYDPQTAQFLTRDPLEATTGQPYQYVGGDPLDARDPSGLDCGWTSPWDCGPSLQQASDWAAGFGDTVTFGGTKQIRRLINYEVNGQTDDMVNHCDDFYHWGNIGGDAANVFDSIVGPGTVSGWLTRIPRVGRWLIGSGRVGADSPLFGNDSLGSGGVSGSLNQRGTPWAVGWSVHPDVGLPVFRIRVPGGDHLPVFFGQFL